MQGRAALAVATTTDPPGGSLVACLPSKVTLAPPQRASKGKVRRSSASSGSTRGLNDSECGATGVRSVAGTEGATKGPPALRE
mgnify:CR=1 FL=1